MLCSVARCHHSRWNVRQCALASGGAALAPELQREEGRPSLHSPSSLPGRLGGGALSGMGGWKGARNRAFEKCWDFFAQCGRRGSC